MKVMLLRSFITISRASMAISSRVSRPSEIKLGKVDDDGL